MGSAREPTREELAEALRDTAHLLYDVWRCNTEEERSALGARVGATVDRWAVHPSWILSGERP